MPSRLQSDVIYVRDVEVRKYPGRRTKTSSRVLTVVTAVLGGGTALMVVGLGEAVPLFAQGTLLATLAWLLFLGFDALFPGVALPRPLAACVGEDGIQTEKEFFSWSDVAKVRRQAEGYTPRQHKEQQRENEQARREGRKARGVVRRKYFVRLGMKVGRSHALMPAKPRKLLKDLQKTLKRHQDNYDMPDSPSAYRTAHETHKSAALLVLDARESKDERVEVFLELNDERKGTVLGAMANEEMRRLLADASKRS